jgi:hypothetical protein
VNSATLELALKKQRLQIAGDALRIDFARHAAGLAPAFAGADYAVEGVRWVRRNPPKAAWRWARRAFVGWQAWRKLRDLLERRLPA